MKSSLLHHVLLSSLLIFTLLLGCGNKNEVKDIDGNVYPTVKIGEQVWMAENLRSTRYRDSTLIPNVNDGPEWSRLETGAWAHFDNNLTNDATHGKLYNWYAVDNPVGICPTGWHVPSDDEWWVLTRGWFNGNFDNPSGFAGMPSGVRTFDGDFIEVGSHGYFWSSSGVTTERAAYRKLLSDNNLLPNSLAPGLIPKKSGLSVRCLRD